MAESKNYVYQGLDRPTLPYISYASVADTQPHFVPGSQNTLGTAIGYLEKRPGFSTRVTANVIPNGTINRMYCWERWDGAFFLLASSTDGTNAYVSALEFGVTGWTTLFTLNGSTQAFDFVVSRNLVFFGNGFPGSMQKWDGTHVTMWGVNPPTIAPSFSFTPGTQATATATESGGAVNAVTVVVPGIGYNPNDPPLVSLTGGGGIGASAVAVVSAGPVTGSSITNPGSGLQGGNGTLINQSIMGGGGTGLTVDITRAGGIITALSINQPGSGYSSTFSVNFGVVFLGGTQAVFQFTVASPYGEVTAITVTGGGSGYTSGPTVVIDAPGINAYTGYQWGYTYTTIYGHESNMSPLSNNSGVFTDELVNVLVTASTDTAQVNGVNLYRTTDGGSNSPNEMQLVLSGSNTTGVLLDSVADVDLQLQTGPALLANTPPTPCYGFVYWNSRIWGFINGTVYFSGAEEISNGVPEEAWPSGLDGNFQPWPQKVYGLGQTPDLLAIGLANQFWQETGDSLDTFRIALLLDKRGVRGVPAINSIGGQVIWFDKSHQLWVSSQGEVGEAIRPDLANVDTSQAFVGMHVQDVYHWIYILDPINHVLYTYDLDLEQWNTPWTIPGAVAIVSGQLTGGDNWLLIAFSDGHVCYFTPGTFNDNGTAYADGFYTNLFNTVPGGDSTARNRDLTAQIEQFEVETNQFAPSQVQQEVNDDPTAGTTAWQDITQNIMPPSFQIQGLSLIRWVYRSSLTTANASRVAFQVNYAAAQNHWILYTMDIAYRKVNL